MTKHRLPVPYFIALLVSILLVSGAGRCEARDNYCGVYSVYSILGHYSKQDKPFADLLRPPYIFGKEGSTAEGLTRCLMDRGVPAKHFSGLTALDLKSLPGPAILHVRGNQATRNYEHWVVYLGENNGLVSILDPSRGRSEVGIPRLMSVWDGVAVVTAPCELELAQWCGVGTAGRLLLIFVLGCAIVPVALFIDRWFKPRGAASSARSAVVSFAGKTPAMLAGVLGVAVVFDLLNPAGVLLHPSAAGAISSVRVASPVPEIGLEEGIRIHQQAYPNSVWVDSRLADDYAKGYIPGAVSLPVDAGFSDEDAVVSKLPKGAEIIVYCQSAGCRFGYAVAQRLRGHGFSTIRIFKPGFGEWKAAGESIAVSSTDVSTPDIAVNNEAEAERPATGGE